MIRLSPYLATCTELSRRSADKAILDGRIHQNGVLVSDFYVEATDGLTLDGKPILKQTDHEVILWAYNKPAYQIVTRNDPYERYSVFEALADLTSGRLVSVGRLDYESEGLLLLTNTPALAHALETSRLPRTYHIWVRGRLKNTDLSHIVQGCCLDGIVYRPCEASIVKYHARTNHTELLITLDEGKKREVRVLMSALGTHVDRLIRLSFGPFHLNDLKSGYWDIMKIPELLMKTVQEKHQARGQALST